MAHLVVLDRHGAREYFFGGPWACISITTEEGEVAPLCARNRIDLVRVCFADVLHPVPGYPFFDRETAHDILDLATRTWERAEVLMVHCDAGLSRSAAVAAALCRLKGGDRERFRAPPFHPNELVYRTLLEVAVGRGDYQGL